MIGKGTWRLHERKKYLLCLYDGLLSAHSACIDIAGHFGTLKTNDDTVALKAVKRKETSA